jgi:homospermidine synthase
MLGYGSIGQGLTEFLFKHCSLKPDQLTIIAADVDGAEVAACFGLSIIERRLDSSNYAQAIAQYLKPNDVLINVSVEVSSKALVDWCRPRQVLYLDTCVEPWAGGYHCPDHLSSTTNYFLRHEVLSDSRVGDPTAVVAHGANPGLVSHFVKEGLLALAVLRGVDQWDSWPRLAQQLGVKTIQIAERDTQYTNGPLPSEGFYNTWSVDGFLAEAGQPAEIGWGSHETLWPVDAHRHGVGDHSGIYLSRCSVGVRVKSWVPSVGAQEALLIAHHEALSIANFLTVPGEHPSSPLYRPTVFYAYHPAPMVFQSLENMKAFGDQLPCVAKVLRDELVDGVDELGVLFVFDGGAYWYGSTLSLEQARALSRFNSATSLQVVAGVLGALAWMLENPREGVVEAERMDQEYVMRWARPYLGHVGGWMTDWRPSVLGGLQFEHFLL